MIDYVHLSGYVAMSPKALKEMMWTQNRTPDGEVVFYHNTRGVEVRYYPRRKRMTLKGKLMMLIRETQVLNVDDVYGVETEKFLEDINAKLNGLLLRHIIDIRKFHVLRIDYCFNVQTEFVTQYVVFLNQAFARRNRGTRKNYTEEKGIDGSVYIKTRRDYDQDERRNYVLKFYDKTSRLRYQSEHGEKVSEADWEYAKNVLRLEVQCGDHFIASLCKSCAIRPMFGDMFSYSVAFQAVKMIYRRVYGAGETEDFYAYEEAKKCIPGKSVKAKETLRAAATVHAVIGEKYRYGCSVIKDVGIYPYCLLPKTWGLKVLENPLKLIQKKLDDIGAVWR